MHATALDNGAQLISHLSAVRAAEPIPGGLVRGDPAVLASRITKRQAGAETRPMPLLPCSATSCRPCSPFQRRSVLTRLRLRHDLACLARLFVRSTCLAVAPTVDAAYADPVRVGALDSSGVDVRDGQEAMDFAAPAAVAQPDDE
jgi:hypothetical protein